jgi:hypothetical protein
MKTQKSIKAIIRKDKAKADGRAPICIQVIINGEGYRKSLNEYVTEAYWDAKSEKVKKGYPSYASINDSIDHEKGELKAYLTKLEVSKQPDTIDKVKEYYAPQTVRRQMKVDN